MSSWKSSLRPDSHLSLDTWAELRNVLRARQRTNSEQAAAHEATVRDLAGQTNADSVVERNLAEVCAARCREAVREVELALERLDAGTYGLCESCGAPLPLERLEAIPEARFCVACPISGPAVRRGLRLRSAKAEASGAEKVAQIG